ncbi:MAG: hypothetical protein ACKPB9_04150 [Dolichospermum sp.]
MTTELLQKVIQTVETLPIEEQNTILRRWLYELEKIKVSQTDKSQIKLSEFLLLPDCLSKFSSARKFKMPSQ